MKVAIIGLGPHGRRILSVIENRFSDFEIVGLVDLNKNILSSFLNYKTYINTEDLYIENKVDLVFIATNADSHKSLTINAIDNGVKYIMVEKPMACSIEDCRDMMIYATKNNVLLSVNQSRRFSPIYNWIKEQKNIRGWGEIFSIYIQRPGIGLGCLGTHSFDLANYIFDKHPQSVSGWVDNPHLTNPRGNRFKDPGGLVILDYGNEKKAIISQLEIASGPRTLEIHYNNCRIRFDEKFENLEICERDQNGELSFIKPPNEISLKVDMYEMIENLIKDLVYNNAKFSDSYFGFNAVEILIAAYESNKKNNKPVKLPINDEKIKKKNLPIT